MSESPVLTKDQRKAIGLIADGMSNTATARSIGCSIATIGRWAKKENFAKELELEKQRREEKRKRQFEQVASEQIASASDELRDELAEYHKATINVQKQRLVRARMLMEKAIRRLQDLPDEALSAADAIRMLDSGDRLFEKGLGNWADAIALEDVMSRLGGSNGET